MKSRHVGPEHLLLGIVREERSIAAEILLSYGLQIKDVREEIARQSGVPNFFAVTKETSKTPHLQEFTRDLTDEATQGKLDPLIGRESEIERIVEILCRRTKNNPVLIGEAGVGKTAIIEGLAQRIVDRNVPSFLENKRILSLDLSLIVAGTNIADNLKNGSKKL